MKNLIKLVLALVLLISVTSAVYYPYKTSTALSADISMNNHKITDLAAPTASNDASTKGYVDDHWGIGGGTAAVFMVTADYYNTMDVLSGWNNFNVVNNLNWVQKDSMNGWDSTNKKYVAQVAGKYFISGEIVWDNPSLGGNSYVSIYKNGNIEVIGMPVQNYHCFGPSVSGIVDLNVGDYVQLSVCHDSASTMRVVQWPSIKFQGFFLGL